jgi:protein SCO1/2
MAGLGLMMSPVWATVTDSVYNVQMNLTDQNGQQRSLDAMRGKPVLVAMFYTSCQMVCPMIMEAMKATDAQLTAAQRDNLALLLVSFDPQRDTVMALKATAEQRGLSSPRWTLARSDDRSVRRLAAVLGVRYRPTPDGEFNHTSTIFLLDADGRIAARTNKISGVDPALVAQIRKLAG